MKNTYCVIDFETTGFSPELGDRITEVAAVKIKDGKVTDQFESLVKTNQYIPDMVSNLNGITENILDSAPPAELVMTRLVKFIGKNSTLVAHNASFDRRFFQNELELSGISEYRNFICTMLLSRRLYQYCTDHTLSTMAKFHDIDFDGTSHRAMPDTMVAAQLFINILHDLEVHNKLNEESDEITPIEIMLKQRVPAYKFSDTARKIYNPQDNKRKHIINKSLITSNFESYKKKTYDNGDTYQGELVKGKRHGKGKYTFINGDTFEGGFINDIRHGKGIYTWVNGDFEEQDYIQGKKINFRT